MSINLTVQVNGLYAMRSKGGVSEFQFPILAGGVRHGVYVAIPTDRIQKFIKRGKPVFPRACLPGPAVSSIFAITKPLTIVAKKSRSRSSHVTRGLLRLADAYGQGGSAGDYGLKDRVPLLVLKNGALRTFASAPFDEYPIQLVCHGQKKEGKERMVDNVAEWKGDSSRILTFGKLKIQLKGDLPVTISVYALPNSQTAEDRDMKHFVAFYNLLRKKPGAEYYPELVGVRVDGYPGCVVGTVL
jgi:hypothetical protein